MAHPLPDERLSCFHQWLEGPRLVACRFLLEVALEELGSAHVVILLLDDEAKAAQGFTTLHSGGVPLFLEDFFNGDVGPLRNDHFHGGVVLVEGDRP